ncbi:class I SAM-dependent methyltransferase [Bacteroidota bacterium]
MITHPGSFYKVFIDPLMSKVHRLVAYLIPEGARVIDIACGNGTLALKISDKAAHVTGIDLSPEMISFATRRAGQSRMTKLKFIEMEASDLSQFADKEFDVATTSMAIHQFQHETGIRILKEMTRISKNIIVLDYNYPLPRNFYGFAARTIESMAGKEHHQNFKTYIEHGGIAGIADSLGIKLKAVPGFKRSAFTIVKS